MLGARYIQCLYGCRRRLITSRGFRNRTRQRQPGIQRRLEITTEDTPDVENMKPEDLDVDAMEADIMQAGEISDTYYRYVNDFFYNTFLFDFNKST